MTVAMTEPRATRRGGRGARRELRTTRTARMLPTLERNLPLVEPMDEEQIRKIDDASMAILEDIGVVFRDPEAIADWKRAGADIRNDDRVRLDRGLVRELIKTIPDNITLHATRATRWSWVTKSRYLCP